MRKIFCKIFALASLTLVIWASPAFANTDTTFSEAYIPSEYSVIEYVETSNKEELLQLIKECEQIEKQSNDILNEYQNLDIVFHQGILNVNLSINRAKANLEDAQNYKNIYQRKYELILQQEEEIKWEKKSQEYPAATQIWKYLKNQGYNDYVCAGIIGNLMAEVGGQTLDIQWWLKGNGYYGMCQWNKRYFKVWNQPLEEQLKFLVDTIDYELNTFGYAYKKGFDYNSFCNLTNEKQAALAFAKCYERCGSGSYNQRQKNATVALNYFVN